MKLQTLKAKGSEAYLEFRIVLHSEFEETLTLNI